MRLREARGSLADYFAASKRVQFERARGVLAAWFAGWRRVRFGNSAASRRLALLCEIGMGLRKARGLPAGGFERFAGNPAGSLVV